MTTGLVGVPAQAISK
jgi:hypothetical protein